MRRAINAHNHTNSKKHVKKKTKATCFVFCPRPAKLFLDIAPGTEKICSFVKGTGMDERLPKEKRIRGQLRVAELFAHGTRARAGRFTVRALPNDAGELRVAAIAGRKLGSAPVRNAMKRRIRAAVRTQYAALPQGWDAAIIASRGLLEKSWDEVRQDLRKALELATAPGCGGQNPPPRGR